ncbi:MAG TPA: hypothetical protein VN776_11480 [Terracidiphilus sp.]|nr:hypothetical protein [Terracidiphilus sp.]
MSDAEREAERTEGAQPEGGEEDVARQGPSLTLLYSLIALALAAAIGFALMIVMPFHHRR